MQVPMPPLVSVVIIGRNEGKRLDDCLNSVYAVAPEGFGMEVIYVDSASLDGSPERAREFGAKVIEVQPERPSAALGRNAGWRAARGEFVLFLDADTILEPRFIARALAAMRSPDIAVVWGHRRERFPEQSLYVRVLDLDWVYPPGESEFCGGDALMRREALERVEGFDDTLIAGEEPELCRRLREHGYRILHVDVPMTGHDLAINQFSAYWRRALRAGHAYAEISYRYRNTLDPLWSRDARRNFIRGLAILASPAALASALLISPWLALGLAGTGVAMLGRSARRCAWKTSDRVTRWLYVIHAHVQQVPILFGQLSWHLHRWQGRRRELIEYKQ